MRFHLFGLAHVPVREEECICPFTHLTCDMAKMLLRAGHEVVLYGPAGSTAPCTEFVELVSEETLAKTRTDGSTFSFAWVHTMEDPEHVEFVRRGREELKKRYRRGDISLISYGWFQRFVAEESELAIEFIAGYSGTFHSHVIYPSYAWMHTLHRHYEVHPEWNHAVVPHCLDRLSFPEPPTPELATASKPDKEDYLVFIGRLVHDKGPDIAADVAEAAGLPLKIAGRAVNSDGLPDWLRERPAVDYQGTVRHAERVKLLSNARAAIFPTRYIEAFGMTSIEAMACGTPIITSDFGAHTETNVDGLTGYRCRDFRELIEAVDKVRTLNRSSVRKHFEQTYSLEAIWPKYARYFERVTRQRWSEKGWYS